MFANTTDPDSIALYYNDFAPLKAGERTLTLNLALRADGQSLGGLLFDHTPSKTFIAMTIRGDGAVGMYGDQGDGFTEMGISENVRARMDGSDVLEIRQKPGSAEFFLNEQLVFQMNKSAGFAPSAGILMAGTGRFAFDGFRVKTVGNDRPPGGRGDEPFPPPRGEETAETEPFPPPRGGTEPGPRPQPERPGPQTSPGSEPDQPPPREATAAEIYVSKVIAGTTLGVFFHELGHAVIGELKLPATGPEEDVADGFSAFVLGSVFEDPENWENAKEEDILQGIVQYSSLLWYYNGQKMEREGRQEGWQGEHAPSLRRFRNSFCIIYGSDPQRFESLADQIQLGERTKARCLQEYTKRYRAWEALLKPVSRNLGPDEPGDHPADAPGGKVLLSFEEPQTDVGRVVTALVRDTDVMKEIADYLQTAFVWPRDLQIEFRNCDQVNAWYDPQAGKVTMCYSIVEHFSKVVFEAESSGGTDTKPDRQPRPDPRPQPAPRRDPQPPRQQEPTVADAMAFFVGTWQATMPTGQGSFTAQVTYAPDRTYRVVLNYPQGPTEVYGTWSAKQLSDRSVQIDAVPTDWSPKQYCNPYGHCQPNYQYASQVVVHLIDQNQVNAEGVVWRRLR